MKTKNEPIQINYYMVFVTRDKRKVFNEAESVEIIKAALLSIQDHGLLEVELLEIGDCYIHLACHCDPSKSPNQIVSSLKRTSYQAILERIPNLNSLWAREVILRTTPIQKNEINDFLKSIKRRG